MPGLHIRLLRIAASFVVILLAGGATGLAQSTGSASNQAPAPPVEEPAWSFRASGSAYFVPDEENYVQPTAAADRGALHLEARYNYEDHKSISGFVGWNLEFGEAVTLAITPMIGAVGGRTDGLIPALELDFTWRRLELYSEGEYVIPFEDRSRPFLYNWSEGSVWATEWLRAGVVAQRTRIFRARGSTRDLQGGFLVGVAGSRVEGTCYVFNPGSDDQFVVASVGVTFGSR
jgi:hypothetical protein